MLTGRFALGAISGSELVNRWRSSMCGARSVASSFGVKYPLVVMVSLVGWVGVVLVHAGCREFGEQPRASLHSPIRLFVFSITITVSSFLFCDVTIIADMVAQSSEFFGREVFACGHRLSRLVGWVKDLISLVLPLLYRTMSYKV